MQQDREVAKVVAWKKRNRLTSKNNIHLRFVVQTGDFVKHGEAAVASLPESTSLENYGARVTDDGIQFGPQESDKESGKSHGVPMQTLRVSAVNLLLYF